MTSPDTPTPQPAATPSPLAEWSTRAAGFLIDAVPIVLLNLVFFWSGFLRGIGWLIAIGYIAYMGYFDGLTGQTPGKVVMGIRVVDGRGELIGSGQGIGRKFAHIVDALICGLGYLLPIVDQKKQTIADKLVQTYVVTGAEKKPFAVDLWMPPQQES